MKFLRWLTQLPKGDNPPPRTSVDEIPEDVFDADAEMGRELQLDTMRRLRLIEAELPYVTRRSK